MAEVVTILVFFGVIVVTALIFGIWFFITVARAIVNGLQAIFAPRRLPPMPLATRGIVCTTDRCRGVNPIGARFCRKCGSQLPQVQQVTARRAAMW